MGFALVVVATVAWALMGSPGSGGGSGTGRQRPLPERDRTSPRGVPGYRSEAWPASRPQARRLVAWDRQRLWSNHVDWEPAVAADPRGSRVYQLATRYYAGDCVACPDPVMVFRRSDDGGATWGADRYPFRGGRTQNDAGLAVDRNGTVHAVWLQDFEPGVVYAQSRDGGDHWSDPIAVTDEVGPAWSDHPLLLVAEDGRDVYVAFNASDSWIASSHDGGVSFAPPVRTNDDGRYWFHTGGALADEGAVLFAATDYSQSYLGVVNVNVLRSADGGVTWTTQRIDTTAETPGCPRVAGCYLGFYGPRASVAVDRGGSFLLVYNGGRRRRAPQRLFVRSSRDGVSWRRRTLRRPGAAVNQAFPRVVAGRGADDFRVAWMDDRREPGRRWNTYVQRTRDSGKTWDRPVRVSVGGPATGYRDGHGFSFPYGDYLGLAVDVDDLNHVIWGAGESYSGNGGVWYARGR